MGRVALALALLAACYQPSAPPGTACSETQRCPKGLECDRLSDTCVETVPPAATFAAVSAGGTHTCAIDPDGALWCWGGNDRGELGTGDVDDRLVPARVSGFADWTAIAAGSGATCGLRSGGTLWCWGDMRVTGTSQSTPVPTQIDGEWQSVAVGFETMCAASATGDVACHDGALPGFTTTKVGLGAGAVATSNHTFCAIDGAHHAVCWGQNNFGQLGNGNTDPQSDPVPVGIPSAQALATGTEHACAIDLDGGLWCWGRCGFGEAGPDAAPADGISCPTPLHVAPGQRFVAVSAGEHDTCAVRDDAVALCFGLGEHGETGANAGVLRAPPTPIDALPDGWAAISAGIDHTCGVQRDGATLCWGANARGQLGDGLGGLVLVPVLIDDASAWQSVAAGAMLSCGVRVDGTLWCWGRNSSGELADGSTRPSHQPQQIGRDRDWATVAPGWDHVCAIKQDQSLWCWGRGEQGQLGVGEAINLGFPQHVTAAGDGWSDVAGGTGNTCGIRAGGPYCWGQGWQGPSPTLLNPTETEWKSMDAQPSSHLIASVTCGINGAFAACWSDTSNFPSSLAGNWDAIASGRNHQCGLAGDVVLCVGDNGRGQLGTGAFDTGTTTPTQEVTHQSWRRVDAGSDATCGITTGGVLACWGSGDLLGIGAHGDSATPLPVGLDTWLEISVGDHHVCAIDTGGALYCWGDSITGERGDGRGGSDLPVRVLPPT
jgi:alpha-tubulin suppressor-like RCC1 family protein